MATMALFHDHDTTVILVLNNFICRMWERKYEKKMKRNNVPKKREK
jgi:hypothetical protein